MPDIQTALTTALSKMSLGEMNHVNNLLDQWADAEATTMTTSSPPTKRIGLITNNVSRETFNCVRDNPGLTRAEIVEKLGRLGFKKSSVSSLIAQFMRDGQFRTSGTKLYAINNEYKNLPQTRKKKQIRKVTAGAKPKAVEVPETPTPPAMLVRRPMPSFNAQEMVNRWSAYQAREVYQELKTIFGA
jgi:hypothetical protein